MPTYHVPDTLMLSYAAGSASEGESLLVASHAALCAQCAAALARLESVGGALLENEAPHSVSPDLLKRTLGKLHESPRPQTVAPVPQDTILPSPLARLVGPYDRLAWKRAFIGLWYVDLPLRHGAVPVRLRRFGAGMLIPMHAHRGAEFELVLAGGAVDERDGRRFLRGDVACNGENDVHRVRIDDDGECVSLGLQDARVEPRGVWSRLMFGYLRW